MRYLVVLLALILVSCGEETPVFYEDYFVVGKTESYGEYLEIYTSVSFHNLSYLGDKGSDRSRFVAPKDLFEIGDTVRFDKPIKYIENE